MERWRVTYKFEPAVPIISPPQAVDALSLTLHSEDEGLRAVVHEFDSDDALSRDDAMHRSGAALSLFLSVLGYLQLQPLRYHVDPLRLHPPRPSGIRFVGSATGTTGRRPVEFPDVDWLALGRSNLRSWITLAAQAQQAVSPADALWLYAVILEDWKAPPAIAVPEQLDVLMSLRHFVSHASIDGPQTQRVLREKVPGLKMSGQSYRYDPTCRETRLVLSAFRNSARAFVDETLAALLADPARACRDAISGSTDHRPSE